MTDNERLLVASKLAHEFTDKLLEKIIGLSLEDRFKIITSCIASFSSGFINALIKDDNIQQKMKLTEDINNLIKRLLVVKKWNKETGESKQ
jgi:hypothetical protein